MIWSPFISVYIYLRKGTAIQPETNRNLKRRNTECPCTICASHFRQVSLTRHAVKYSMWYDGNQWIILATIHPVKAYDYRKKLAFSDNAIGGRVKGHTVEIRYYYGLEAGSETRLESFLTSIYIILELIDEPK